MSQMYYQIPAVAEDSSALFCQFEQDSCIIVNYLIVPSGPSYSMARVYFLEYSGEPACTCNLNNNNPQYKVCVNKINNHLEVSCVRPRAGSVTCFGIKSMLE